MQPWMRFYRLDNQWVSTNIEGIQDAIRNYQLDKYYVPTPFGDKLMEYYTTEDQRAKITVYQIANRPNEEMDH